MILSVLGLWQSCVPGHTGYTNGGYIHGISKTGQLTEPSLWLHGSACVKHIEVMRT